MTSDHIEGQIVAIRPSVRANEPYDPAVRARCFVLYSTVAARKCAAVARLIAEELAGSGDRIPAVSTIAEWCRDEAWPSQADDLWRSTKHWGARELQVISLANAMLGQQRRHEILLGEYEERMGLALQYLKASEISDRFLRDVLPLAVMQAPPVLGAEDEEAALSTAEKADLARSRLIKRVKGEQVHLTRTKSREERKRELIG
jgi:hypothetical protein